ncbi:hypothetical protein XENOCAPTIV_011615, partial [Xenoophorus captivus]
ICMLPLTQITTTSLINVETHRPDQDIEAVFTAPVSAVCGVTLDTSGKKEYLISGISLESYSFLSGVPTNVLSVVPPVGTSRAC